MSVCGGPRAFYRMRSRQMPLQVRLRETREHNRIGGENLLQGSGKGMDISGLEDAATVPNGFGQTAAGASNDHATTGDALQGDNAKRLAPARRDHENAMRVVTIRQGFGFERADKADSCIRAALESCAAWTVADDRQRWGKSA